MPEHRQGDIHAIAAAERAELTVIFAHIGFQQMARFWRELAQMSPDLAVADDPLARLAECARRCCRGRWLWYVPDRPGVVMSERDNLQAMDEALRWAKSNGLRRVVSNGIPDIDHGIRGSYQRARLLSALVAQREEQLDLEVTLVSLTDAYVGNKRWPPTAQRQPGKREQAHF